MDKVQKPSDCVFYTIVRTLQILLHGTRIAATVDEIAW
jgi:hypothetical protein